MDSSSSNDMQQRSVCRFASLSAFILFCILSSAPAHGQYWRRTARIVTPVETGPVRALLDTLIQEVEETDRLVRRGPDRVPMPLPALRDTLISNHGTGIATANTVFIGYSFEIDVGSRLERDVRDLHFHLRPGPLQEDIPILYVDAQQPWMQDILSEKGTALPTNQAALIPFRQHLDFVQLARRDDTQIVEMGGETVREGFRVKKEALIRQIERLTYGTIM